MAAKLILKDTKAPLLFFRSQLLAVAAVPKTTCPKPQLIQSIQPSNQNPLPHLSDLRHYLYQPPSPMLNGLGLSETSDSTLGGLQARGTDDDEENDSDVETTDDEYSFFFENDEYSDYVESTDSDFTDSD